MYINPPEGEPRHGVRLRNVVRRLEGAVAILDDRLRLAVLARPPELTQSQSEPSDGITDLDHKHVGGVDGLERSPRRSLPVEMVQAALREVDLSPEQATAFKVALARQAREV